MEKLGEQLIPIHSEQTVVLKSRQLFPWSYTDPSPVMIPWGAIRGPEDIRFGIQ